MKAKILSSLIILLALQMSVIAQIHKANRLFARYDYTNAIPYYQKEIKKNNNQKTAAMQGLADCYRLTNNSAEAAAWYGKVVENPGIDPDNYYYYGQALRSNGNSKLAQEQFKKFASLKPGDPRGNKLMAMIDQADQWKLLPQQYKVANAAILNSVNSEFCPTFFNDGIMFTSDRHNTGKFEKIYGWTGADYLNIFYADARLQPDTTYAFSDPKLYSGQINEPFHDGPASFSNDGSLIFFTRAVKNRGEIDSSRFYTNRLKLFSAHLEGKKWGPAIPFPYNSEDYSVGHPALSNDGNTLYFVSDMPGGQGGTDLYISKLESEKWSKPVNLGTTLNSAGNEMFPILNNDSILYFSSDGLPGIGGLDVFRTAISTNAFTQPENLHTPINSTFDDFGILFNNDETSGIFSSNRVGGVGEDDLYTVLKVQDSLLFAGFVKDKTTMLPLEGATVFAWNSRTHKVKIIKTDAMGHYSTYVRNGDKLTVKGMSQGYAPDLLSLGVKGERRKYEIAAPRDLLLNMYKVNQVFRLENIYYNFDKWNIRDDASVELDKVIAFLKDNPPLEIELSSHTDCRGSDPYNEKLSDRRAESADNYIVERGIEKSRITAKGYGESKLVNKCSDGVQCTPAEHQANRRTEIKITGIQEAVKQPTEESLDKYKNGETLDIKLFGNTFFETINPMVSPESQKTTPRDNTGNAQVSSETRYKVQLMALRDPIRIKDYFIKLLAQMPELTIEELKEEDGLYHYSTGAIPGMAQAREIQQLMKQNGWNDCFIVDDTARKRD